MTTPEIDAELHEVYAWYACMRYGSRDEDTETAGARYNYFKREYDALINEMDRRYIQREAHRKLNR